MWSSELLRNGCVALAKDVNAGDAGIGGRASWWSVRAAQILVSDASSLSESGQHGSVYSGRVVANGVLPREEKSRRILCHVVVFRWVSRNYWCGQNV